MYGHRGFTNILGSGRKLVEEKIGKDVLNHLAAKQLIAPPLDGDEPGWIEAKFEFDVLLWSELRWSLEIFQKEAKEAVEEIILGTDAAGSLLGKDKPVDLVFTDFEKGSLIVQIIIVAGGRIAAELALKAIAATMARLRARKESRSYNPKKGLKKITYSSKKWSPNGVVDEEEVIFEFK